MTLAYVSPARMRVMHPKSARCALFLSGSPQRGIDVGTSKRRSRWSRATWSGASRTRTGDLLGAIQALFQLSYSPAGDDGSPRAPASAISPAKVRSRAADRSVTECHFAGG